VSIEVVSAMKTQAPQAMQFTANDWPAFIDEAIKATVQSNRKDASPPVLQREMAALVLLFKMTINGYDINTISIADYTGYGQRSVWKYIEPLLDSKLVNKKLVPNSVTNNSRSRLATYEISPALLARVTAARRRG
jgi:hypothetical protein